MGLIFSRCLFEKFSTALEWIALHVFHPSSVIHVLDDFLFITPSQIQCQSNIQDEGITSKWEKISLTLDFLHFDLIAVILYTTQQWKNQLENEGGYKK